MTEHRLHASVTPECKLVPEDRAAWGAVMSSLRGERVVLVIGKPKVNRSARANRFWWSQIVPTFQEVWSLSRTKLGLPPYDKDEAHDVLVQVLIGYEDGPMPGTRVRKRTSEMDSKAFAKLIDDARELALQSYGMFIAEPGQHVVDEVTA